jgi:predicted kinase
MIEVLVGMIASGKSTYARRRADEGALVVCHDDLTEMLHARYRYEQELRSLYREMEEGLAATAIKHGKDVIIDRTHLTHESRARWIGFGVVWGCPVIAVAFPITGPYQHAFLRHQDDDRGRSYEEWLQVARHHHSQSLAEPLSADEGFAEIRREVWG